MARQTNGVSFDLGHWEVGEIIVALMERRERLEKEECPGCNTDECKTGHLNGIRNIESIFANFDSTFTVVRTEMEG